MARMTKDAAKATYVVGGFGDVRECGRGHCESRCAEVKRAVLRKTFRLMEESVLPTDGRNRNREANVGD